MHTGKWHLDLWQMTLQNKKKSAVQLESTL